MSVGSVFAVFSALKTVAMLCGVTIFSQVLSLTVRSWTGAFYAVAAAIDVLCLIPAVYVVLTPNTHLNLSLNACLNLSLSTRSISKIFLKA